MSHNEGVVSPHLASGSTKLGFWIIMPSPRKSNDNMVYYIQERILFRDEKMISWTYIN